MPGTSKNPERDLARTGDELEERIGRLDEHIEAAHKEAAARHEDQDEWEDVAGDWEDTDDDAGGEDPASFDDPEVESEDDDED